MKLLVRTQDNLGLFELKNSVYIEEENKKYYLSSYPYGNGRNIILGIYKKKENAMKVIDEIQKILVNMNLNIDIDKTQWDATHQIKSEIYLYRVYQIPKEKEINNKGVKNESKRISRRLSNKA